MLEHVVSRRPRAHVRVHVALDAAVQLLARRSGRPLRVPADRLEVHEDVREPLALQRLGARVQEPRRLVEEGLARLERDVVGPARMVEDPQRPRRIALALPDVDDDLLTLTAS